MSEKKYRAALEDAKSQYEDGLITEEEYRELIRLAQRNLMKAERKEL